MVEVVYTSVNNEIGVRGTLFEGLKFWLSRKVPQRSKFIEEVQVQIKSALDFLCYILTQW